ncbi:hypothetical protein GGS21DRAFT_249899 [Xylaria nigripes]|nr:hypothetical protein GGS21DRAFT_249899 [Xylaria nigripes]
MKHAAGHESEKLFRIGYVLLIVQERRTHTLRDLACVVSANWVSPTVDHDLIDRVRDRMALTCNFAEELSQSDLGHFSENDDKQFEVQDFLNRIFLAISLQCLILKR